MNIYVGNLSYDTAENELRQAFEAFGQVTKARIITDKMTNTSKGFGFVDMANQSEAEAALSGMSGKEMKGRVLKVSEARRLSEDHPGEVNKPSNGERS